jgi:uncharacterized protein DUF3576
MLLRLRPTMSLMLACGWLAACGGTQKLPQGAGSDGTNSEYNTEQNRGGGQGRLFSEQGLVLGVGKNAGGGGKDEGAALGVNAYLWRGALDTLSFMPLSSADPFGGVIITDWYQPAAANGERFKATAYILGRQLRTDGIKVNVFRQVLQNGQWMDAQVSPATTGEIEDKVLARARELRSQTASN